MSILRENADFSHLKDGKVGNHTAQHGKGRKNGKYGRLSAAIESGAVVLIHSAVIGEQVAWCRDDDVRRKLYRLDPDVVSYTLSELGKMKAMDAEDIQAIHCIKKAFHATLR